MVAGGVEGGDEGQAREGGGGGGGDAEAESVVEAAKAGACGDHVGEGGEGEGGERGGPVGVDAGADDPVVGCVGVRLVGAD